MTVHDVLAKTLLVRAAPDWVRAALANGWVPPPDFYPRNTK